MSPELTLWMNNNSHWIFLAGGALTLAAVLNLVRKPAGEADEELLPLEQSLEDLARRAKWLSDGVGSVGVHVRELIPLWRDPAGYADENYALNVRLAEVDSFFNEMVQNAHWFQVGPHRKKQRAVIIQILELLDKHHPTPSVAKGFESRSETDNKWGGPSFAVLSKVTLLEHLLTACEMGVAHLLATNQSHRIPDAMIALLAHDLGKLPQARSSGGRAQYGTGDHPVLSAKILGSLKYFDDLPLKTEIHQAVLHHHNPNPEPNSLHHIVQIADHAARHAEFRTRNQVDAAPEWVSNAPMMNRTLLYASVIPGSSADPDLRLAERKVDPLANFSTGVLGDMNNLFYAAEQHQEPPISPVLEPADEQPVAVHGLFTLTTPQAEPESSPSESGEPEGEGRGGTASASLTPAASADSQNAAGDPAWERVVAWVDNGLSEGDQVDAKTIQKKFRIKLARAEAILSELMRQGYLVSDDPPALEEAASFLPEEAPPEPLPSGDKPETTDASPLGEPAAEPAHQSFKVPLAQVETEEKSDPYPVDISSWFQPDAFLRLIGERIDRAWRWDRPQANLGSRQLVEVTETSGDGAFYCGITSNHHTWLNVMALRQLAAEQLYAVSPQGAIALFENAKTGGDQEFQDLVLRAIVRYFQKIGIIDTGLLPLESPYYSVNCEVVMHGGTKQGNRRMIPFHWYNFYESADQVMRRRSKYPFVSRIKHINPAIHTGANT